MPFSKNQLPAEAPWKYGCKWNKVFWIKIITNTAGKLSLKAVPIVDDLAIKIKSYVTELLTDEVTSIS